MATEDSGSNTALVVLVVILVAVLVGVLIFRGFPGGGDEAEIEVDVPEGQPGEPGATWVAPASGPALVRVDGSGRVRVPAA